MLQRCEESHGNNTLDKATESLRGVMPREWMEQEGDTMVHQGDAEEDVAFASL